MIVNFDILEQLFRFWRNDMASFLTVKIGYNEHARDQQNVFVINVVRWNREPWCCNFIYCKTKLWAFLVGNMLEFVITASFIVVVIKPVTLEPSLPQPDPRLACTCQQLLVEAHFRLHHEVPDPAQLGDEVRCAYSKQNFSQPAMKGSICLRTQKSDCNLNNNLGFWWKCWPRVWEPWLREKVTVNSCE